jgi:hypothetical protein
MEVHCKYDQLVPIRNLKPHPKNPNTHTPEQIRTLANILAYQGWRRPIRVSNSSGYVTAGHGAIDAAKLNHWESVPVDFQDYRDIEQELSDLTADNAIAAWANLDLALVNHEIVPELGPDFDIDVLGIKDFEIEPADKFDPTDESEQSRLDKTQILECPHCGKSFERTEAEIIG